MKKKTFVMVIIALVAVSFSSMAQRVDRTNFKAGVHLGIPFGDISDFSNFELGLDLGYHWGVSELIDAGISTGFMNAFINNDTADFGPVVVEGDFPNIQYVPVAGAFRIYPTYDFKIGADVGYAVGINDGNTGGLYLRPIIGANLNSTTEINISYVKISDDYDFSMATLGILFLF
ncbi:hypothetical protein [Flagellimonas halotolerans]|uniref:Outer membrane protein beta-barrel domain-containing protein n=1 Tax=Flagellimonas halotolerans TaxID=3112164 RepID=A0ABU6IRV0_9FLAO|nr:MULTISPECIES: hypothetical protein [unclassified Allomuricauda]MEC3965745.1 hypothetical protein [Muricauda sp. SYSU M86414]MEC4265789.1 hypothetical protein [Muricauda sp. SYSU M84420]